MCGAVPCLILIGMTSCEEFLNELDTYVFAEQESEICQRFRDHLSTCGSCRRELIHSQEAMDHIPTALPDRRLRADVKQKLMSRIDFLQSTPDPGAFNANTLEWEESPIPGVRFHWLRQDENGSTAAFIRISPGHVFPNHRHIGAEDCLVLQGGFSDGRGQHERGDYIHYEPGTLQADLHAFEDEECILFIVNQQGIEFTD